MYSLYLASCDWILFLKFIHFVAYVSSSFLFHCWIVYTVHIYICSIYLYLYLYLGHRLFVHLLVDGYLSYFQFGALMNTAIINIYLQAFLYTHVFISLMKIPGSGIVEITGSTVNAYLTFKKLPNWFPKWLQHFIFSPTMYENSSYSTSSPIFGNISLFNSLKCLKPLINILPSNNC